MKKSTKGKSMLAMLLCAIMLFGLTPTTMAYKAAEVTRPVSCGGGVIGFIDDSNNLWMYGHEYVGDGKPKGESWREEDYRLSKVMENVRAIYCGRFFNAAIKTDDSLWMWGSGSHLCDNYDTDVLTPTKVLEDVATFEFCDASKEEYYYAVKNDGTFWNVDDIYEPYQTSSPYDDYELKENNTLYYKDTLFMENVSQYYIAGVCGASMAIKTDGSLWTWGANDYGSLGIGLEGTNPSVEDPYIQETPEKVMDNVKQGAVDWNGTMAALKYDGSLWLWGNNTSAQIGDGTSYLRYDKSINLGKPSPIKVMENVAYVDTAFNDTLAVKTDGTIWSWGCSIARMTGKYTDNMGTDIYVQGFPVQIENYKSTIPDCAVTLDLDDGTGQTTILCDKNETIDPPSNPEREGYFFAGWYKDEKCTKAWNFDTDTVSESCTLYAKWLPKTTSTVTAEPSSQDVKIDGETITFNTYILRNEQGYPVNFVKLRDVAYILNGTKAEFNVDYRNNAVRLDARKPYTTQNGAELTIPSVVSAPAKTAITPVLTGGVTAPIEAFLLIDENGGGHNYFKLRDIGKIAGFNVEWDEKAAQIVITTTKPYAE